MTPRLRLEELFKSRKLSPRYIGPYQIIERIGEVDGFVYACLTCHKSKIEHQKLLGLMQPLSIPEWKLDSISMDFMISFPKNTKGCDSIWVIIDRLTKLAHFIPIKINFPL